VAPTSLSLLERLKAADPEPTDWRRLQEIYLPLITGWLRRIPGLEPDAEDLAQEVMLVLVREISRFERRREGSFRAWLRQVTINRVRAHRKQIKRQRQAGLDLTDGFLDKLSDPNSDVAREWDAEHDRHVFEKLLAVVQPDFRPSTWEAFRRFAIYGCPAAEVAVAMSLNVNSVLQAKSRVLRRLREEAGHLLE